MQTEDIFSIKDKVVVLTGAGGALMGTLADGLAVRGARVVLLDIVFENAEKAAAGIIANGGYARAFQCNVLDSDDLTAVFNSIAAEVGIPDCLINGAGGNHPAGSTDLETYSPEDEGGDEKNFFDLSDEGFRKTNDLNFMGTVLPCRVFGKKMAAKKGSVIINVSSMSAITPLTKVPAYSAAKSAVANFTKWLAVHLAPSGIRVNSIAPGFFITEQLRYLHFDRETGEMSDRAKKVIAATPFKRYGEPEELTGTIIWLMSEASSFVTGTIIPIDGGFSSYSI